ncbi:MAG: flagellar filament capping protein FliD, partial [Burkholderiales bacterium]|nr:flagellar filament capping protein FliD [Phycisphaerae bacterium]
ATEQVRNELYAMVRTVVPQAGKYRILGDVGLRVGEGGALEFDQDKFTQAYATDPASVEALFTNAGNAIADTTKLGLLNRGTGVQLAVSGGADFQAKLRDGSTLDVSLAGNETLGQVVASINAASPNKLRAEITDDGRIKLSDLTAGATTFALTQLNASQAIFDLGISVTQADGVITGRVLKIDNAINSITGGIGVAMQQKFNKLIDPVNGVLTRQNKTLDDRTTDYNARMEQLDTLLASKRLRLEKQFSALESSLSQLQGQQRSLGSIQTISANR